MKLRLRRRQPTERAAEPPVVDMGFGAAWDLDQPGLPGAKCKDLTSKGAPCKLPADPATGYCGVFHPRKTSVA